MSELLKINVNEHTEKKNGLTYLSWAWAWAEVLKIDPEAIWEPVLFGQPDGTQAVCLYLGQSALVQVRVTIKFKTRSCMLPVMDHRNKAIQNPDAFQVNTAIMRCLAKAIAMHGLGLYIYAGEDLPESDSTPLADQLEKSIEHIQQEREAHSPAKLAFESLQPEIQAQLRKAALFITAAMPDAQKAIDLIEVTLDNWPDEDRNNLKSGLWYLLDSKTRSAIKRHAQTSALRGMKEAA